MISSIHTIPSLPGTKSKTFSALPLDTHLTVSEVFAHHAHRSPDHAFFVYADGEDVQAIRYAQAYRAQLKVASQVKEAYQRGAHLYTPQERPQIGILAVSGVFCTVFCARRLNLVWIKTALCTRRRC
jgi:hypothetical protein